MSSRSRFRKDAVARSPSQRDWRGYRAVKSALKQNPKRARGGKKSRRHGARYSVDLGGKRRHGAHHSVELGRPSPFLPWAKARQISSKLERRFGGKVGTSRRNPRYNFVSGRAVKEAAQLRNRKRYQTQEQATAKTGRYPVARPRVEYASATNPKRYSRQKRKAVRKYGSVENRLYAKAKYASRMMDRHEMWDPDAKNRRRKKWRTANYRAQGQVFRHFKHEQEYRPARPRKNPKRRLSDTDTSKWRSYRKWSAKASEKRGRRSNPKRDGTPTRGEKRQDKFKDHLRLLRERGQKAADQLKRLLGRGVHRAHSEPVLKAPKTQTQIDHPAFYSAALTSDQKFVRDQISNVDALMADVRQQMREIGDDDESLNAELTEQLVSLGKQKKLLLQRADEVRSEVLTNPRRDRRVVLLNPRHKTNYRQGLVRLSVAVRGCSDRSPSIPRRHRH